MASVGKEPGRNGYKIRFYDFDNRGQKKRRQTIWLGGFSKRQAETVKGHVEQLLAATAAGVAPDIQTARWLGSIGQELRKKLVKVELIAPTADDRGPVTLGPFLADYVAHRRDVKASTQLCYRRAVTCLVEFFGVDRRLDSITAGDAERWRIWLAIEGNQRDKAFKKLSDNTVRRRTGRVRQFFGYAIKQGVISSNPFDGLPASVHGNTKRQQFVDQPTIEKALEVTTCPDLRAIIALSRYGGLRSGEPIRLTWEDVDLEAGRLTIHADKTEHHEDGGFRICPIFPELRPFLQRLYDRAKPGIDCPMSDPVITRWRSKDQNIRTAFQKVLKQAGITPWPKLFHNLRASRQTELLGIHPVKDVCDWRGNTEAVAMKHYAMATADSFQRAVCGSTGGSISANQQISAKNNPNRKPPEYAGSDGPRDLQNPNKLAEAGLEPARPIRVPGF
tara:strand:- start:45804 stop:47144 length:1341 start_codon:yes stop_codon:yes gene_type:complete